jgi:antitoxin component YwqK of YwqJK toxin-antitoxin module
MSYAVLFLYSCFYLYGGYGGFIGGIPFAIACFSYKYINNRNYLSHPPALQEKMLRRERFLTVLLGFTVFFSLTLFYFLDFSLFRDENHFIPGQIIQGEFDGDHRRFIQISNDGYYIIQDFKRGGVPTTNPYRIKNKDDLYKSYLDQWSIDGLYAYQDCDAGCEMRFINYRNGRKEGIEFGIFTNGNINGRRNFFHNLPDGEFITYYENGNKRSEGKMANRMNDMLITVWWPSGQKKMERELKNSRLVKEIVWYENGAKKKEGHGKPEYDYWVSWHKNGQISSESYWKKSLKSVGKCSEYGENGEILHKDETSQEICSKIYKKWIDDES